MAVFVGFIPCMCDVRCVRNARRVLVVDLASHTAAMLRIERPTTFLRALSAARVLTTDTKQATTIAARGGRLSVVAYDNHDEVVTTMEVAGDDEFSVSVRDDETLTKLCAPETAVMTMMMDEPGEVDHRDDVLAVSIPTWDGAVVVELAAKDAPYPAQIDLDYETGGALDAEIGSLALVRAAALLDGGTANAAMMFDTRRRLVITQRLMVNGRDAAARRTVSVTPRAI